MQDPQELARIFDAPQVTQCGDEDREWFAMWAVHVGIPRCMPLCNNGTREECAQNSSRWHIQALLLERLALSWLNLRTQVLTYSQMSFLFRERLRTHAISPPSSVTNERRQLRQEA